MSWGHLLWGNSAFLELHCATEKRIKRRGGGRAFIIIFFSWFIFPTLKPKKIHGKPSESSGRTSTGWSRGLRGHQQGTTFVTGPLQERLPDSFPSVRSEPWGWLPGTFFIWVFVRARCGEGKVCQLCACIYVKTSMYTETITSVFLEDSTVAFLFLSLF